MKRYDMSQLSISLGWSEGLYLTREKGEQAYRRLRNTLESITDREPLVILFPPNQIMDVSFCDESIAKLAGELANGEFGDRGVLLEGLTDDTRDNLEAALSFGQARINILTIAPTGDWQCMGHLEDNLRYTLKLLASREHLTAGELATLKELSLSSASNRLKRLYDRRLIKREVVASERGLAYKYSFWRW